MIKKRLSLFFMAICFFAFLMQQSGASDFKVKYRPNTMSANQMGFFLQIENLSGKTVNMEELKLFYFFTLDNSTGFQVSAQGGPLYALEPIYHKNLFPQADATDIIELNFNPVLGTLESGALSDEFEVWITGGVTTRENDYSHDNSISPFGENRYNKNILLTFQNRIQWGSNTGVGDQTAIVGGGWYNDVTPSTEKLNNYRVRNDDGERIEFVNDGTKPMIIFDFKDISTTKSRESIEKITLKILHYEDNVFDGDDLKLTVGTGLKPGSCAVIRKTVFMPPRSGIGQESYFLWDITNVINSIEEINSLQLKIEFNTSQHGICRLNRIFMEMDYYWPGKHSANALLLDQDNRAQISLRYGHAYIRLPRAGGTLEISTREGFDLETEGLSNPLSTFPDEKPYYTAVYSVNSSIIKLTRISGAGYLTLKYTN